MRVSNHGDAEAAHPDLPAGKAICTQPLLVSDPTSITESLTGEAQSEALVAFPAGRSGWAVLVFLFVSATFLHAQDVRFSFDKQKILLGEPIQLKIEAVLGAGQGSDLFSRDTLPHFEVLDQSRIDTIREGGGIHLVQTMSITSWDSGSWKLPSLIHNGMASQPVTIEVGYTSPWDAKQPYHDIKGIIPVKHPGQATWWWYLIGLAVLAGLFLLFFPPGKKGREEPTLDSSAYKKAMQQLEALQKRPGSGAKEYYTELVNIFRTYLKGAKGIQSFSKTTGDLSIQLQSLKQPQAQYNNLVQTLRLSDLVKFAQYTPGAAVNTEALNTIKQSITSIEGHAV